MLQRECVLRGRKGRTRYSRMSSYHQAMGCRSLLWVCAVATHLLHMPTAYAELKASATMQRTYVQPAVVTGRNYKMAPDFEKILRNDIVNGEGFANGGLTNGNPEMAPFMSQAMPQTPLSQAMPQTSPAAPYLSPGTPSFSPAAEWSPMQTSTMQGGFPYSGVGQLQPAMQQQSLLLQESMLSPSQNLWKIVSSYLKHALAVGLVIAGLVAVMAGTFHVKNKYFTTPKRWWENIHIIMWADLALRAAIAFSGNRKVYYAI